MTCRLIAGAMLVWISGPAKAEPLSCQAFVDAYEIQRSEVPELPPLFDPPFLFQNLEHLKYGQVEDPERMEQPYISVKNHIGWMDCLPDGTLTFIEVCAQIDTPDEFNQERFSVVSQGLIFAALNDRPLAKLTFGSLMEESSKSLRNALVRGDKYPQGRAEIQVTPKIVAAAYNTPAFPGITSPEYCASIEQLL